MDKNDVLVFLWSREGEALEGQFEEVLTFGRQLSDKFGGQLKAVVLGALNAEMAQLVGRYGAVGVDHLDDPKLLDFAPNAYVEAMAQYVGTSEAAAVLFAQTFEGRLPVARLAGRLDAGVVMNALGAELTDNGLDVTATAFGGDTRVVYQMQAPGPYLLSLSANAVSADPVAEEAAPVATVQVDLSSTSERIRVSGRAHSEGPGLEHAEVIVAGGRGLGEAENFRFVEELAATLGGMSGASRPIVDDGWADPSRQVGLTGKITKPALYIAAGISGASQHMVGCSAAKTLVAINTDADAAIFRYARYGIVADCVEVLGELNKALG